MIVLVIFVAVAGAQVALWWSDPRMNWRAAATLVITPVMIAGVFAFIGRLLARRNPAVAHGFFVGVLAIAIAGRVAFMTGLLPSGRNPRTAATSPSQQPALQARSAPSAPRHAQPAPAQPLPQHRSTPPLPNPEQTTIPAPPADADRVVPTPAFANQPDPKIAEVTAAVQAELRADGEALVAEADKVFEIIATLPVRSAPKLKDRGTAADKLASEAATLAARLRAVREETERRLIDAGVDQAEAVGASIRFSAESRSLMRATACDRFARFAADAREESDMLAQNLAGWKVERRAGEDELTFSDPHLRVRVAGVQGRMRMVVKDRERLATQIKWE